jgi:hypothetical protein
MKAYIQPIVISLFIFAAVFLAEIFTHSVMDEVIFHYPSLWFVPNTSELSSLQNFAFFERAVVIGIYFLFGCFLIAVFSKTHFVLSATTFFLVFTITHIVGDTRRFDYPNHYYFLEVISWLVLVLLFSLARSQIGRVSTSRAR